MTKFITSSQMTSDAANPLENNDEMKTSVIEGTNDSS